LHEKYGGDDMPRLSIAIPKDSGSEDYIVEINLRKFTIMTYPRVRYLDGV
jgi:hypothetical protein